MSTKHFYSVLNKLVDLRTWIATGVLAALLVFVTERFRNPAWFTGYVLFGFILILLAFRARKRLSMVPLGSLSSWKRIHIALSVLGLVLFWLHVDSLWPAGPYEKALAVFFYLVNGSGILGYVLDRIYPSRLTETGIEVIYERIPAEISELREEADQLVMECTEKTGSPTLARHYAETLRWYFRKPRFVFNHVWGGASGLHWIRGQFDFMNPYLSDAERVYLSRLRNLAEAKDNLDFHYAVQSLLRNWLSVHIPLAVAMFVLILWHLLIVNIYAQWSN